MEYSKKEKRGGICFYNIDNIEFMKTKPDNYYDLAIVDPPYGINASEMTMGSGIKKQWNKGKNWDKNTPTKKYFDELFRVSKNQIIFGGNYFELPLVRGWIFWDKGINGESSFADGELAWTSFNRVLRKLDVRYKGFLGADKDCRIHPTQKPILLYRWILDKYAEKGMKILDTHGGSMSIAIAADIEGFDLDICEIDKDYYNNGIKRFDEYKKQGVLWTK